MTDQTSSPDDLDDEPVFGAYVLREKPHLRLLNHDAFVIPEDATRAQLEAAADWVRVRGGLVPFVDDRGLLVVTIYPGSDYNAAGDRYYEWVAGGSMLTKHAEHQEFSTYNVTGATDYKLERVQ